MAPRAVTLLLTLLLSSGVACAERTGDGATPVAGLPSWWECATCSDCVLDASAVAPPQGVWNSVGQCPRCVGCTHQLQMLNLTVPLPRLSVGSVRMHPGNTGASIFLATDANGTQTVLKVHGIVSSMVSAGKISQLKALYKGGAHYLANELVVGHALSALADECQLGNVSIREWLAPVRGVVPLTGEKLYEAHAVMAEYARGASLEMLTIKLPSADLLRLLASVPHTAVRDAVLFDLLFLQGDRHAENVFLDDNGGFKLIDSRDAAMEEGLDSLFFASTLSFERNRVGNEYMYDRSKNLVSHHWPQNTLDYRCHVAGGAIGKDLPSGVRTCVDSLAAMGVDGVMDRFFLPAIKWAAESTANAEMLTGRAQRYAQVVVKQAQLLREHGTPT
jgi:hypothetical protein